MSARTVEIVRNVVLVVGVVASISAAAYGVIAWSSEKSPEKRRKEIEHRTTMNELREAAARGAGREVTSNEIDHMDDLKPPSWSGKAIVATSAGGLVLTLVVASILSASAHVLRSGGG